MIFSHFHQGQAMDGATVDWEAAGGILDSGGEIEGSISVGAGMASVIAIPVPGTKGLSIALKPNGFVPKGGSTSTLFIQDAAGGRHLRLDYGYNKVSGKVDFHWNQKGTFDTFGIKDHSSVGRGGAALYKGARYFKYGGRALMVVGLAMDGYEVVTSDRPFRQLAIVAAGWAGAWAGCKVVGGAGAAAGTLVEPGGGTAVGGLLGCFVGGAAGYWAGKKLMTESIDSAEEHLFHNVQEVPAPAPGASGNAFPSPLTQPPATPIPRPRQGRNWSDQPICSRSVGSAVFA
jgi:hypothetical protein